MAAKKHYTKEFKIGAVKLVVEQGYTLTKAGQQLGVTTSTISNWVRDLHGPLHGENAVPLPSETQELIRMRKELKQLKEENQILKKAAAYFAKESL